MPFNKLVVGLLGVKSVQLVHRPWGISFARRRTLSREGVPDFWLGKASLCSVERKRLNKEVLAVVGSSNQAFLIPVEGDDVYMAVEASLSSVVQ